MKKIFQDTDLQLLVKMTPKVLMLLYTESLNAYQLFLLTSSQFNDLVYITWRVIDRSNTKSGYATGTITITANYILPNALVGMSSLGREFSLALRLPWLSLCLQRVSRDQEELGRALSYPMAE